MKIHVELASGAVFAVSAAFANSSNDTGFNPVAANNYCEDLAESYQVLDEDRSTYLSQCISAYRESPPGGEGSDISPHTTGY